MDMKLTERAAAETEYPSSDGQPMAETDVHRKRMTETIETLEDWFAPDPNVYVSGNLLVYYVPGNRYRHLAPDVFVVRGVPKRERERYLVWEEKPLEAVIELTSKSTEGEDLDDKFALYQNVLKVREYFLFDPRAEYLDPPFQGHRLVKGHYEPIEPVDGRLPSKVLGLHLERRGSELRLYDPKTKRILPTRKELNAALTSEVEQLRRELEDLKRPPPGETG